MILQDLNDLFTARTTWLGSSVPLNRTNILESVSRKTRADYEEIQRAEQMAREARRDQWPEFSEYTEKFTLRTKTEPSLSGYLLFFQIKFIQGKMGGGR